MQLVCDGIRLDLYDNAGLQFTHNNPLFSFDDLKCERTTQFKLPRTQTNDKVFSLARIPAYSGEGMRRKFSAQLQSGAVVLDGYLYISDYDGNDYNAIFVTGELVELQAIRDAGKIGEYMSFLDVVNVTDSEGVVVSPSAAANALWANVRYKKGRSIPYFTPSISLDLLYAQIVQHFGVTAQALPAGAAGVRIVPPSPAGVNRLMTFTQTIIDDNQPSPQWQTEPYNSLDYDARYFEYEDQDYTIYNFGQTQHYLVRQFKTKTNLRMTFSDQWAANMYLVDFTETAAQGTLVFLGDRSFTKTMNQTGVTTHGEPLAGRTIDLPTGATWLFVCSDDYEYVGGSGLPTTHGFVWFNTEGLTGEWEVTIKSAEDIVPVGDVCALQDNLPDVTFIDLLKTIAALSGRVLNYTSADGITFDELDIDNWSVVELQRMTKRGEVTRTFADYGQRSIVHFDSDDSVPDAERLACVYTISNDNIEVEKELQQVPFSEGQILDNALYIQREPEQFTLGIDGGGLSLAQVTLPKNAGLQTLCDASTQFKVTARLNLIEYKNITPKTILQIDGQQYVWTSRTWQKNTAEFTLAKI